jgi:hypothetical protein
MRRLRHAAVLAFLAVATQAQSPPVSYDSHTPWAALAKDSAVFFFPLDTNTEWTSNVLPQDSLEYMWIVRLGWPDGRNRSDIGLKKVSSGGAKQVENIESLITECKQGHWYGLPHVESKWFWRYIPLDTRILGNGLVIKVTETAVVERIIHNAPGGVVFVDKDLDTPARSRNGRLVYLPDPEESRAREISGHLSSDEYAVYQTVLTRSGHHHKIEVVLALTTVGITKNTRRALERMEIPDATTRDSFLRVSNQAVELDALSQIGFTVLDADYVPYRVEAENRDERSPRLALARVSRVGFNTARDEAVVYMSYSCGDLCGKALLIALQRRAGRWYIVERRLVWIS